MLYRIEAAPVTGDIQYYGPPVPAFLHRSQGRPYLNNFIVTVTVL